MQHWLRVHQLHEYGISEKVLPAIRRVQLEFEQNAESLSFELREDSRQEQLDSALQTKGAFRENGAVRRIYQDKTFYPLILPNEELDYLIF